MSAVMEQLQAVPGASDKDRPAWLAERRRGVTATQVRDLYLEQLGFPTYTKRADLIGQKLGRIPEVGDLSHVPVIAWGNLREPVVAEAVRLRYGIEPESRVFKLAADPRRLASPDGVGRDFDGALLLSEIKTAGMDVSPGSEWFEKKGYLFQCVWGMRVLGARRCLYVWEERVEVAQGVFEPGEQHFHWLDYDESLATRLDDMATQFLAELEESRRNGPVVQEFDDELDTLAVNYLRYIGAEKEAAEAKKQAWAAMKARLADKSRFQQESPLARVTWTRGGKTTATETVTREAIDEAALAAAHPDVVKERDLAAKALARAVARDEKAQSALRALWPEFTSTESVTESVTTTVRENLTVTAPRIKEMRK